MRFAHELLKSRKLAFAVIAGVFALPQAFAQESRDPGSEFQDCPNCPVMVVLPTGEYDMGSPPVDQGRPYHEGEFRRVIISKPFAVGKFEVTFDEWDACTADGKCAMLEDEGWGRGRRPAINVTWTEADRYTKWLSQKTGKSYRLLTEAEWEYAARAGAGNARFFGLKPEAICTYANVYDKTAHAEFEFEWKHLPCDDGFTVTAPAGSFKPNAFGLHDMLGNVWEWTQDCDSGMWRNAPNDSSARVGGNCSERAYRGASWINHPPWYLRTADRYKFIGARYNDLGFRIARMLP
jgi:formylglycine-generating enzyme required for sulfatase activity